MSNGRFDEMYAQGVPPWDIGRPQNAIVALVDAGEMRRCRVIDVGCGTGENALFCAGVAREVVGVDSSRVAIDRAREKAKMRGVAHARFWPGDALDLQTDLVGRDFDVAIDCGCFHVFDDAERARYVTSLARVLRPGARLFLLCFSDEEPAWGGPRRVRRDEIRAAFDKPFSVETIEPASFEKSGNPAKAWLARIALVEPTRASR